MNWTVPAGAWKGEAAFILGGGPSLKGFDAERLRGKGRVIGVNDAGLHMAPWCDVLYFADRRWFDWNRDKLGLHTGPWKVTRRAPPPGGADIKVLQYRPSIPLSRDQRTLAGFCGGGNAINLAYLLGAVRIVLLGFDMRPGNWHDNHKMPPKEGQHRDKFIPAIERMAPELQNDGCEVVNATPGSALTCFPICHIEDLL